MFENTKKILSTLMLTLLMLTMSQLGFAMTNIKQEATKNVAAQFVQTAKAATIVALPKAANEYSVTLKNVDKFVSYFSDRPTRVTGMLPLSQFLAEWNKKDKNSMQNDPPNAAIVGMQASGKSLQMIGVLSQPNYDATTNSLSYRFKLLSSPEAILPKTITFHHTAVFLDDMMVHWGTGPFGHNN